MKKLIFLLTCFIVMTEIAKAQPDWLKQAARDVGDGVRHYTNTARQIITVPTEVVKNAASVVIGIKKPEELYKPFQNLSHSAGQTISSAQPIIDFVKKPQDLLYAKAQDYAKKFGGKPGEFIFDLGTFSQRFFISLVPSGTKELAAALQDENPLVLSATPLAAAIHEAREKHKGSAKPLPDDVKIGLKDFFADDVLNRAMYAVGSVDITLPNFIGQGTKFMGEHYAVVVDDIIVFNTAPPSFDDGAWWWGHEVTHIKQFKDMGVELFAYNYLKDLGRKIESEANTIGDSVYIKRTGTRALLPLSKVFKRNKEKYEARDIVIAQCKFDNDKHGLSFVVTSSGKILAINPLNGKYKRIGYTKPAIYAGSEWTFKTRKVFYSVLRNGEIVTHTSIKNLSNEIVGYQPIKIGNVQRTE